MSDLFSISRIFNIVIRASVDNSYFVFKITESAPNPQFFFLLNKSLHLFETYCAIWRLFQPNLDFLKAAKVTKSSHHLSHDRASKGMGLFLT